MESSSSKIMMKTLNNTYFTDDIWLQIFPYLPLKLIFKFKCVSKVWNSHLSGPNFHLPWMLIYIFKQRSLRKFTIAYLDDSHHSQFISNHSGFSFEFLPNPDSSYSTIYFLGSSNGLVLCYRNTTHFVCNPLTQKWVQLPPTPHQFDMERLATVTGFECDCTRYKVVRIPPWERESNKFNIQVFSSDSGKWNFYEVFFPDGVTLTFPQGVVDLRYPGGSTVGYNDGVIIHRNVLYWMGRYYRIVVYNLENNESEFRECRMIELPDRGIWSIRCLGESNGLIFYARIKRPEWALSVWVLQEENFHLLHENIDLHDLFAEMSLILSANFTGIRWDDLINIIGFNPVDSNVVIIGYKNYIWAYNIGTRKYVELCHPSFLGNEHSASDVVYLPLLLKPMPTILPSRSW